MVSREDGLPALSPDSDEVQTRYVQALVSPSLTGQIPPLGQWVQLSAKRSLISRPRQPIFAPEPYVSGVGTRQMASKFYAKHISVRVGRSA